MDGAETGRPRTGVTRQVSRKSPAPQRCGFAIRRPENEDEEQILALLRETVGETAASKKTAAFWRWKHSLSPFGTSYTVCAWEDEAEKIVGLRTLMWWNLRGPGNRCYRAARAVDTATHPAYQRRGIFSALTRFAIDDLRDQGAAFIFNTPNDQSLPGYLKMGWHRVERWPIYVRPVRWLAMGWNILTRGAGVGSTPLPSSFRDTALMRWSRFRGLHGEEFAQLVTAHEERRTQVGYRTERDLPYLDWRYGGHPDIEYRVHSTSDALGLEGVVVARAVPGALGLKALVITEVFLRHPSTLASERLLESLLDATTCDYVMAHFADGTMEHRALGRAGFVRAPGRGYTFTARPLRSTPKDPTRPDTWDLTLSELEIF